MDGLSNQNLQFTVFALNSTDSPFKLKYSRTDTSVENENGGYVFFETSTLPQAESTNTVSAMIESPLLGTTGNSIN